MTHLSDGARLEVRYPEPALDLATLADCLADAVPVPADGSGAQPRQRWSLLRWDAERGVLGINTRAVLQRLTTTPGFRSLKPTDDSGFLRDAPVPRSRARAHLGGRILEGSGGRLRQGLDRLVAHLDAALDDLQASGFDPAVLVATPPAKVMAEIGERVGGRADDLLRGRTRVRRTAFAPVGPTQRARQEEVARLMSAVEEIDGDRMDHFERLASSVRALLLGRGLGEREIDAALAFHRQQAEMPGTQLARFFDFLEDDALARIRLQVTFRMMEAIAAETTARLAGSQGPDLALLAAYSTRATGLYERLTSPEGEDLWLNLAGEYGAQADFALHDELITVGFVGCLPVWPEWVSQIFERQQRDSGARSVATREVSYRFRVNGINPFDRQSAYLSRLARFERWLLRDAEPPPGVRRSLAELVFLAAVVPSDVASDPSPEAALRTAREVVDRLQREGRTGIAALIEDLRARAPVVDAISRALVGVLKTAGTPATTSAAGRSWDYHVNVLRSVVDPQRIASPLDRPLAVEDAPGRETLGFFRHVRISAGAALPGSLLTLRVRVRLAERSLHAAGDAATGQVARVLPSQLAQVVWRPFRLDGPADAPTWEPTGPAPDDWLASTRVEVQYDVRTLGLNQGRDEASEQLLAAFRCAFAILVYTTLLRLFRRVGPPDDDRDRLRDGLTVALLRLQEVGRDAEPLSGDAGLFAAAQAVEQALGRDLDVRMQGLVLDAPAPSTEKRRGLYGALFAGFPLVIERRGGGELEPAIGLLTFAARPCNDHPDHAHRPGASLVTARTYLATATARPYRGYQLRCDVSLLEIREDGDAEELPATVIAEIRRLYETRGCRHILLLAHRYGTRRIGRLAPRVRPPDHPRLLADLADAYPDLYLYPLVRDTFPVTRLRQRGLDEDAFEILQLDEHLQAASEEVRALRHAYTPVYSLATLHVVGEAGKPQSGVCTYFLLRDSGAGPAEHAEQIRANLLLSTSPVRPDLVAVLRGVHYLEAERPVTAAGTVQPVLDPYAWMLPETVGHAGEIVVRTSRRRAGAVVVSLPAVLETAARVLHGQPAPGPR